MSNNGGEITANINDSDNYNLGSEALDGDFILGTEAGLTADIQVEFAQPFFTASRRTPTETAALYAAGHLHPVDQAVGAWPALALPIVYQDGLEDAPAGYAEYRVRAGETLSTASGPFTGDVLLSFWFRVEALGTVGTTDLLVADNGSDAGFQIEGDFNTYEVQTPTDYVLDTQDYHSGYHHAVVWSSGGELYYYVDGLIGLDGPNDTITGQVVFGYASNVNTYLVTNIAYVQKTVPGDHEAVIASLFAAGRNWNPATSSGSWAGITPLAHWTTYPTTGVVANSTTEVLPLTFSDPPPDGITQVIPNSGSGDVHPMRFTGTPNAVPAGATARVVNSGDGGICDLYLIGDTTSEID